MRTLHLIFIWILIFVIGIGVVNALDLGFAKEDAGHAGVFMDYAASARSLGMGRAHTAVTDDAGATYWNPAGLSRLDRKDIVTLYADLHEETSFGFVSYAQPMVGYGTFGLSVLNLRSSNFERRNTIGQKTGSFDQSDLGVLFSHGFRYKDRYAFGSVHGVH